MELLIPVALMALAGVLFALLTAPPTDEDEIEIRLLPDEPEPIRRPARGYTDEDLRQIPDWDWPRKEQ